MTDHVCVTSPSGSKSANKADWSPLKGRNVVIWPDADEPGGKCAETVGNLLADAGAASAAILTPPDGVPEGWDAGDAVQENWTVEQALALVQAATIRKSFGKALDGSPRSKSGKPSAGKRKAPKQCDTLLGALDDAQLWHSPEKAAYATISVNGHREHWRIDSSVFQRWAAGRFYRSTGGAPAGQMLADALRVLSVRAIEDGTCYKPMMRTGWVNGASWLDLCDDNWCAVKITANGWEVVEHPPVKFVRSETMAPLPVPEAGHLIEEFRGHVNADDNDYSLIVAWLVAALWGRASAYPVLALGGEQGSGKTTMARMLRTLADPSAVPALALPKDERDLFVQAMSGHTLSFDNVSKVDAWFSDAVCRLSTGSGFLTRKLHSDSEPFWFQGSRPVLLNGIPSLTDRADLAERALTVRLLRIDETTRQSEDDFWQEWTKVLPGILGSLLDAVSSAVRRYDETKLERSPRMADFARLMAAAEPGLGWETGAFMAAYDANRQATTEQVFESDPVAVAIEKFIPTQHPTNGWEGTATDLFAALNQIVSDDMRRSRFWPSKVNALGNAVDRAAPLLWHNGIHVTKRNTGAQRLIILTVV
ncbi:ATP-binding protein [uncultured Roseibium sp.]|uniref:ATP-binding protein n=1 Tax=uncultured Roseibium sp. TaxID=1936171 RepID=UPI0026080278|nr:ATP-binding protein [uncultured Roseibium sp.]